jgi:hypothetical protein
LDWSNLIGGDAADELRIGKVITEDIEARAAAIAGFKLEILPRPAASCG